MVPWAWNAQFACFVLHVSALAAHTRAMELHPAVSLLVCAAEVDGEGVHALERVAIEGVASTPPPGSVLADGARDSYVLRFPEAAFMTDLGDFRFVCITPSIARHVAGFGAARDVSAHDLINHRSHQHRRLKSAASKPSRRLPTTLGLRRKESRP